MKEIIFGTTNQAKILQVRGALLPGGINVVGINREIGLPIVIEDGITAAENARIKALAIAASQGRAIFSMDNALFLDGLADSDQPALNVRRIPGFNSPPSDFDMVTYYSRLIATIGPKISGHWEYGFCLASPSGDYHDTTIISPRIFTCFPSQVINPGYPLESLQLHPTLNKYMSELTPPEHDAFWQEAIGKPLLDFVRSVDF